MTNASISSNVGSLISVPPSKLWAKKKYLECQLNDPIGQNVFFFKKGLMGAPFIKKVSFRPYKKLSQPQNFGLKIKLRVSTWLPNGQVRFLKAGLGSGLFI